MPSAPPRRQSQPPSDRPTDPKARAAAIAAVLGAAAGAGAAGAAAAGPPVLTALMLAALTKLFVRWGYRREVIRHALRVVTTVVRTPPAQVPDVEPGPAQAATDRFARVFLAWFLERTTARVEAAYDAGAAPGEPEAREERFIDQHLDAQKKRRAAAERVDAEAAKPGNVQDRPDGADGVPGDPDGLIDGTRPRIILLWRAHPDDKVTPECRAADGAWFYADTPPIIGYPGMPHGGTCRCWPANAVSLKAVARGRHVNEAVRGIITSEPDHRTHPGAAILPRRRSA